MKLDFPLTGTKTADNLAKAFAGETQARMRYLLYSETAGAEGYPALEKIFLDTADDERGHAEAFYEFLTGGLEKTQLLVMAHVPAAYGATEKNLAYAAEGELEEAVKLYPLYAREAEQEGFRRIAVSFEKIASIEKRHYARFCYLGERLARQMLFCLPAETTWKCTNCGLHVKGRAAPDICPACGHKQSYFMTVYDALYPLE